MSARSLKERLLIGKKRKAARKAEVYIADYRLPRHIAKSVLRGHPDLKEKDWELIEQGLREWFICCAWRGRRVLGMPSKLVDDAWHEFILDSVAYVDFCDQAFGGYLHHTPEETMGTPMRDAIADTIRAWDRSDTGTKRESVLWQLDSGLGISEPLRVDQVSLHAARTRVPYPVTTGWAFSAGYLGMEGSVGDGGGCGSGEGGGDEGGGSCGGGGCGGGCGGGS